MISEPNELIEQYILGKLSGKALTNFKNQLKNSPQLAEEVAFYTDMANSIIEKDIIELRSNLNAICNENRNQTSEQIFFDLAQNLTVDTSKDFSSDCSISENFLQQIHIENHKKSLSERIHQLSLQTDLEQEAMLRKQIDDFSFWEEVRDAVLETEVLDLRANLKEIISEGDIVLTDYEIDEYLSNHLSADQTLEVDHLIASNKKLAERIKLHTEIEEAINETDILQLRASLSAISENEDAISPSEFKQIDEYLLNYLDEADRMDLETRAEQNIKLKEELLLNSEINEAIIETDIMGLRASLSEIANDNKQTTKIRKLIPDNLKDKPLRIVGAAASVAAIISTGYLSLNHENTNAEKLFRQAYNPYEATGLFRSATVTNPAISGVDLYNAHRYDEAISQFSLVLKENEEHPMSNFFTGLCFMEKSQYEKAIGAFQNVIDEKDNLFIEQAEWYMALCLLGSKKEKDAYLLLNKIVVNNGYYRKNARDLIKKLK